MPRIKRKKNPQRKISIPGPSKVKKSKESKNPSKKLNKSSLGPSTGGIVGKLVEFVELDFVGAPVWTVFGPAGF